MTEQEVNEKLAENLAQVDALLNECAELASEYDIYFSWDGPTYGMGGWVESGEWQASSTSC